MLNAPVIYAILLRMRLVDLFMQTLTYSLLNVRMGVIEGDWFMSNA